jgi:beta-N-acetylhexosaminidase
MMLVCNSPEAVGDLLDRWQPAPDPVRAKRIERLLPSIEPSTWSDLQKNARYLAGASLAEKMLG